MSAESDHSSPQDAEGQRYNLQWTRTSQSGSGELLLFLGFFFFLKSFFVVVGKRLNTDDEDDNQSGTKRN